MSELLDSFSAGMFPPFLPPSFFICPPPSTCQLSYRCCSVRRGLSPRRTLPEPCSSSPVAACHLHVPYPITFSLSLSLYFPFPSHFLCMFLKQSKRASRWPTRAGLWLSHTALDSVPRFPIFSPSLSSASLVSFIWSHSLFPCPHRRVLVSLRSQNEMPPTRLERSFPSLHVLCSERCWRQVVVTCC